jgi:hypothetical protein
MLAHFKITIDRSFLGICRIQPRQRADKFSLTAASALRRGHQNKNLEPRLAPACL